MGIYKSSFVLNQASEAVKPVTLLHKKLKDRKAFHYPEVF